MPQNLNITIFLTFFLWILKFYCEVVEFGSPWSLLSVKPDVVERCSLPRLRFSSSVPVTKIISPDSSELFWLTCTTLGISPFAGSFTVFCGSRPCLLQYFNYLFSFHYWNWWSIHGLSFVFVFFSLLCCFFFVLFFTFTTFSLFLSEFPILSDHHLAHLNIIVLCVRL